MLSADQTEEIRRALRGGVTPLEVARRLGVSLIAIAHIIAAGLGQAFPRAQSAKQRAAALNRPLLPSA